VVAAGIRIRNVRFAFADPDMIGLHTDLVPPDDSARYRKSTVGSHVISTLFNPQLFELVFTPRVHARTAFQCF
jgi:hypothetical protein